MGAAPSAPAPSKALPTAPAAPLRAAASGLAEHVPEAKDVKHGKKPKRTVSDREERALRKARRRAKKRKERRAKARSANAAANPPRQAKKAAPSAATPSSAKQGATEPRVEAPTHEPPSRAARVTSALKKRKAAATVGQPAPAGPAKPVKSPVRQRMGIAGDWKRIAVAVLMGVAVMALAWLVFRRPS